MRLRYTLVLIALCLPVVGWSQGGANQLRPPVYPPLICTEPDGTPRTICTTIEFPDGTVNVLSPGVVRVEIEGGGGADATAIHDNVAGEIAAITDKATPVAADHLVIEDSADSNNKKDILISSLETALEGLLDLSDLQGAVTDAQVPNNITVDLASAAGALSANGANCSAGQYPLGVNASGAAESCTADDDVPESGDFGAGVALEADGSLSTNTVSATNMANSDHGAVSYTSNVATVQSVQSGAAFPGSPASGDMIWIDDDSASGAGDSSGGTTNSWCRWDGVAWECIGGDFIRNIRSDCSDQTAQGLWCQDSDDGLLYIGDGDDAVSLSGLIGATPTLEAVRTTGNIDDTATTSATAPTWGGATSQCRIYEDATLGATIECFDVASGDILTFDEVVYDTDSKRWILDNAGNRDVCWTLDDAGVLTMAAVESCGTIAGAVTFTGAVTNSGSISGVGAVDLGTASDFEVPNGSNPTTNVVGEIAVDNNAWALNRGALQVYDGTANTYAVATLATDTPTNGQVPTWNTGGTVTWETPAEGGGSDPLVSFIFHCQDNNATDGTTFATARDGSDSTCGGSEFNANMKSHVALPFNGVADSIFCEVVTAPGSTETITATMRFAGTDTDVSAVISNTATSASDTGGTTVYTAGQRITVSHTTSVGAADVGFTNCVVVIKRS